MIRKSVLTRLALGATAGLIGTVVLQGLRTLSGKCLPQTMPPVRQDPGAYIVNKAEALLPPQMQEQVPELAEKAASKLAALGYGITAGAVYASLRPKASSAPLEGTLLGLGVWAAGYLGWLPALELMPRPSEQNASELIAPAVRHVLFGIATAASYHQLTQRSQRGAAPIPKRCSENEFRWNGISRSFAGHRVLHITSEVSTGTGDPFHAYPPPFDLASDMMFAAALCPATPLRRNFPGVPFLTIFGRAVLIMWFSRINGLCYHSTASMSRCVERHEGVPYNELNVIVLLKQRRIFVPGIYATSKFSLMLGHRYGMPKQSVSMSFAAQPTAVASRALNGQKESFVNAKLLTSGRWLGRLFSRFLPFWTWPSFFPNGSFIRAFIQNIPRVQLAHVRSGQLALEAPWLPFTIDLLPLGAFVPNQRMRLPAPTTHP